VTYPGFTPVGNATLVVANVLTCNKHSHWMRFTALNGGALPAKDASCCCMTVGNKAVHDNFWYATCSYARPPTAS
jgi:hypothetical protein